MLIEAKHGLDTSIRSKCQDQRFDPYYTPIIPPYYTQRFDPYYTPYYTPLLYPIIF